MGAFVGFSSGASVGAFAFVSVDGLVYFSVATTAVVAAGYELDAVSFLSFVDEPIPIKIYTTHAAMMIPYFKPLFMFGFFIKISVRGRGKMKIQPSTHNHVLRFG